jgi:hypothetical protein
MQTPYKLVCNFQGFQFGHSFCVFGKSGCDFEWRSDSNLMYRLLISIYLFQKHKNIITGFAQIPTTILAIN